MTPVRLEPAAPRSRVKHSTTEPLRFQILVQAVSSEFYENRSNCDKSMKFGTMFYYTSLNKKKWDTRDLDYFVVAILNFKMAAMKKQIRSYLWDDAK